MHNTQKEVSLKYSIVIPAHNEEKYIADTLNSISEQTVLPLQVIVVDDNSTDRTAQIAEKFAQKHAFIHLIHSGSQSTSHEPGGKIIHAFYKGFEQLVPGWNIVSKLDADVILPKNYFEVILSSFQENSKIGIAGGIINVQKNGEWTLEFSYKKHVRGAIKSYSRECFEKIGGLRKSIGWDSVDELLAFYYGFELKVLPELHVKLQKPTGKDYKKVHGQRMGQAHYRMRYGLFISFVSAVKACHINKNFRLLFSIAKGYCNSVLRRDLRIVTKDEGRFIRKYRRQGFLSALSLKKHS
jgi:glycosyltransferase involved in cell wall biosynthesis